MFEGSISEPDVLLCGQAAGLGEEWKVDFRILAYIPTSRKWSSLKYRTSEQVHPYQVWLLCWLGIRLIVSVVIPPVGKIYFCLNQPLLIVRQDGLQ